MKTENPSKQANAYVSMSAFGDPLYMRDYEIEARKLQARECARLAAGIGRFLRNLFNSTHPEQRNSSLALDRNPVTNRAIL